MAKSPLIERLGRRARHLGERALQELLTDDRRADALGMAAKGVQEGRRLLDEHSGKILGALGLATQADLERVTRKMGRLRKRLESLVDELGERPREDDEAR